MPSWPESSLSLLLHHRETLRFWWNGSDGRGPNNETPQLLFSWSVKLWSSFRFLAALQWRLRIRISTVAPHGSVAAKLSDKIKS